MTEDAGDAEAPNEANGAGRSLTQTIGLALGLAAFCFALAAPPPAELGFQASVVLGLLALMACWWVSEAIPIPITSLLPLVVLPSFGVASMKETAAPYFSPIVVLLMGGFIVAKAFERWRLHERLALLTVARAGSKPAGLCAGFLIASAALSAWISNTATTIMLAPVALSVAYSLGARRGAGEPLTVALVLSVAYGATIGGLATPVGTPTNLIVIGALEQAGDNRFSFASWMAIGAPAALLMLPAAWVVLTKLSGAIAAPAGDPQRLVRERLAQLGPWTAPELRTLALFSLVAFFWIFRRAFIQDIEIVGVRPFANINDAVIAIAGAILMFLTPAGARGAQRGAMLLDWPTASRIPWDVILLFGGGLSLAAAITATGIGGWLGEIFAGAVVFPTVIVVLMLAAFVIFATELTSNVATAAALMPVIIAMAGAADLDAAALAAPVALAASCAFMFPMATAPNAIAYATGEMSIPRMASIGLKLNLIGVVLITAAVSVAVPLVLPAPA